MPVAVLFNGGDPRLAALLEAILAVTYERGNDIPVPSILGVLDLVKLEITNNALNGE